MKVSDRSMFCVAPFVTLNVSTTGDIRFCCKNPVSIGNHKRDSFQTIWNSDAIRAIRQQFVVGERPDSCAHCWEMEAKGASQSWRAILNSRFWYALDDIVAGIDTEDGAIPYAPRYIEISLSNLCNLRCRMCFPSVSSSLATIWPELSEMTGIETPAQAIVRSYDDIDRFLAEFATVLPSLDQIYFFGGEPLMEKNFDRILDLLIPRADRISVALNTNLTHMQHGRINHFSKLECFRTCYFSVSVDGSRALNAYIRAGVESDSFEANCATLRADHPGLDVSATIAVQALNILDWPETIAYISKHLDPYYYEASFVVDHLHLSPQVLPRELKRKAAWKIRHFNTYTLPKLALNPRLDRQRLAALGEEAITLMQLADLHGSHWPLFRRFIDRLDQIHGTRILDVVPDFGPYW